MRWPRPFHREAARRRPPDRQADSRCIASSQTYTNEDVLSRLWGHARFTQSGHECARVPKREGAGGCRPLPKIALRGPLLRAVRAPVVMPRRSGVGAARVDPVRLLGAATGLVLRLGGASAPVAVAAAGEHPAGTGGHQRDGQKRSNAARSHRRSFPSRGRGLRHRPRLYPVELERARLNTPGTQPIDDLAEAVGMAVVIESRHRGTPCPNWGSWADTRQAGDS